MNRELFINCPFSKDYLKNFEAVVFATIYCGFRPRCALETDDGSQNRMQKICDIIAACRLSVHDISNTRPDRTSRLPRFNMPLELGLFLGAKRFGAGQNKKKSCIIFDTEKYRYQAFISDIAGQDIHAHHGKTETLIAEFSQWLRAEFKDHRVPGGAAVVREFNRFQKDFPGILKGLRLKRAEVSFQDFRKIAEKWIRFRLQVSQ
jgi:hypothetical protein